MTNDIPAVAGATPARLISVVVRSMNRPSLQEALASVFQQDWRPLEIVVVNASGRAHDPLPLGPAGLAVRLLPEPPVAMARAAAANFGLDAACGEAMIFLDDDDVFLPGHLSKLMAALVASPAAVAAYADVELGHFEQQHWRAQHCFAADFDRQRLLFENYLPIHAVLFLRSAVKGRLACRFDESLELFEDWDFWLQLCECGPMLRAPGVSARYLVNAHGGSGVFEASAAAQSARALLHAKWQQRTAPRDYVDFMSYVQRLFRSAADRAARLADTERANQSLDETAGALRDTVRARDTEIADHAATAQDLRQLVAAREAEIANAATMITNLQAVVAARETELAAWQTELAGVRSALEEQRATVAALLNEGPLTALKRTLKRRLNDQR